MSIQPVHLSNRQRVAIDVTRRIETNLCMRCFTPRELAERSNCIPQPYSFDEDADDINHEFNTVRLENTEDPYRYVKMCRFCNTHLHNRAIRPDCVPDWQKEMIDRYGKYAAQRHISRMEDKLRKPFGLYQEDLDAEVVNEAHRWHEDWHRRE